MTLTCKLPTLNKELIINTSTVHKTRSLVDGGILHISNLAAHTTLNIYKPMEISILYRRFY